MSARRLIDERLPKLSGRGYEITSPRTDAYNCVAWVARDVHSWWEPGVDGFYWPPGLGDGDGLDDYIRLFESLEFERCADGQLEAGFEKIAIYGEPPEFDHVAFQRTDGTWSSKLGTLNDIKHDQLEPLAGTGVLEYGPSIVYMRRSRRPHPLAETGLIRP